MNDFFPESRFWSLPLGRGGSSSSGDSQWAATGSIAKLPYKLSSTGQPSLSTQRTTWAGGLTPGEWEYRGHPSRNPESGSERAGEVGWATVKWQLTQWCHPSVKHERGPDSYPLEELFLLGGGHEANGRVSGFFSFAGGVSWSLALHRNNGWGWGLWLLLKQGKEEAPPGEPGESVWGGGKAGNLLGSQRRHCIGSFDCMIPY